ncbi:MAG: hypothetical protein ACRC8S_19925 [Fimbriiglobus sp.]
MIWLRLRFLAALVLFVAWLGWLAFAVQSKGNPILSRAQVINANQIVFAEVRVGDDGLPLPMAQVTKVLRGNVPVGPIEVMNLPAALPAGAKHFSGPGEYLLLLSGDGKTYRIVGLPRSPGFEPAEPTRPVLYPATDATRLQIEKLIKDQGTTP